MSLTELPVAYGRSSILHFIGRIFERLRLVAALLISGLGLALSLSVPAQDSADRSENTQLETIEVFAEGYRPGSVDLDIFAGAGATPYESEHTKNYELSYKSLFLDDQLSINANLFYIDWKDMQTSGSAQIRSGTYNAGKATVYGGEFQLTWTDNDSFDNVFDEVIASRDIYQLQGQQLGLLTDPVVVGGRITFSF